MERSGARKTPRNQLTNKDLNAEVALDVKGNASKLVVQSFLNSYFTGTTQPPGGTWNSWKFDNFEVSGLYHFTPALYLGACYTYTQARVDSTVGDFNPKWHQLSLKLNYDLSQRTSLFLEGAYQRAISAHTGMDFDDALIPDAADVSSGSNQMAYRIALLHQF
ncbi:porin [Paraburkholderia phytofirmans]|uniref:porin n=1 Tax=Paraburkholderia phytofirmans TaxID=261302 RepID=UPI001F231B6E|nr:porin [Paraburkholderia phytofirmans]